MRLGGFKDPLFCRNECGVRKDLLVFGGAVHDLRFGHMPLVVDADFNVNLHSSRQR